MGLKIRPLTKDYAVAKQIHVQDIAHAAEQGFRTIINNRPDHEAWGQPKGTDIEAAAKECGLDYYSVPVSHRGLMPGQVEELARIQRTAKAPFLAFCAAGARASTLWALSQAGQMETEAILNAVAGAGYDVRALRAYFS